MVARLGGGDQGGRRSSGERGIRERIRMDQTSQSGSSRPKSRGLAKSSSVSPSGISVNSVFRFSRWWAAVSPPAISGLAKARHRVRTRGCEWYVHEQRLRIRWLAWGKSFQAGFAGCLGLRGNQVGPHSGPGHRASDYATPDALLWTSSHSKSALCVILRHAANFWSYAEKKCADQRNTFTPTGNGYSFG